MPANKGKIILTAVGNRYGGTPKQSSIATAPHDGRSHGTRDHLAAPVVGVLRHLVAVPSKLESVAEEPLIPRRLQQRAAHDRVLAGQVQAIGRCQEVVL